MLYYFSLSTGKCPFGFAYVDTPKGDLDSSGVIEPYYKHVGYNSQLYPYSTTEEWPHMETSAGHLLTNTAHWYMECSNSGYCNRQTGECECLEGFWGSACQRQHCPGYPDNECSGHGECLPLQKISEADYGNIYEMWDREISYGCLCDHGYHGGACEERYCPRGLDPFYIDDVQTARHPVFNLGIMTSSDTIDFNDGFAQPSAGKLQIRFFDQYGKGWLTNIMTPGEITCEQLVRELEALPNSVVPLDGTLCTRTRMTFSNPRNTVDAAADFTFDYTTRYSFVSDGSTKEQSFIYNPTFWDAGFRTSYDKFDVVQGNVSGDIFRLEFMKNYGEFRPMEVETFVGDGWKLPSTVSPGGRTIFRSWTDGEQGENKDYFANLCRGVTVRLAKGDHPTIDASVVYYLTGFDTTERNLLKKCLGGSDFDPNNDQDIYLWDHGSVNYPHYVRLLRSVTDEKDGGYYVALVWDTTITMDNLGTEGTFRLLQPFTGNYKSSENPELTDWLVYTTNGVLEMTSSNTQATFDFASNLLFTSNTTVPTAGDLWHGDMSCESHNGDTTKDAYLTTCLNKGDIIVLLDPYNVTTNPQYHNMYTIKRLYTENIRDKWRGDQEIGRYFSPDGSPKAAYLYSYDMYNAHMIVTDLTTNWATDITGAAVMRIYKFYPAANSTYEHVQPCSNRGVCNSYDGLCDCFTGYIGEACSDQVGGCYF